MTRTPDYRNWQVIYAAAMAAGKAAADACTPTPMVVVGGVPGQAPQRYFVEDGVCGFAYVNIKPATHSFARWAKAQDLGFKAYYGGYDISIHDYNQSLAKKEAHANAMAKYLVAQGIPASSHSRMD